MSNINMLSITNSATSVHSVMSCAFLKRHTPRLRDDKKMVPRGHSWKARARRSGILIPTEMCDISLMTVTDSKSTFSTAISRSPFQSMMPFTWRHSQSFSSRETSFPSWAPQHRNVANEAKRQQGLQLPWDNGRHLNYMGTSMNLWDVNPDVTCCPSLSQHLVLSVAQITSWFVGWITFDTTFPRFVWVSNMFRRLDPKQ